MLEPPPKYFRLSPGREVRLRSAYLVTCTGCVNDADGNVIEVYCTYDPATSGGNAPDGRKVKSTMHWVSADHAVDATVALYERLFSAEVPGEATGDPLDDLDPNSRELLTDCKVEPALADTPPGRWCSSNDSDTSPTIPTTPLLFHRTVGLRDEWANIQKRSSAGHRGIARRGDGTGPAPGVSRCCARRGQVMPMVEEGVRRAGRGADVVIGILDVTGRTGSRRAAGLERAPTVGRPRDPGDGRGGATSTTATGRARRRPRPPHRRAAAVAGRWSSSCSPTGST